MTLPPGWGRAVLSDLVGRDGFITDGDWVESKDQDADGEVRLTQLADVGDGNFRDRSARFLTQTQAAELKCTFLAAGDVLIARMPDPLGRACVFPQVRQPCVSVVDVCIVRTGKFGVEPRWLMWAVNSPQIRGAIAEHQQGTTRKRIAKSRLLELEFPVPPLAEQRRIVESLETHVTRLDAAVATLERVRANLERYRAAVLHSAFEEGTHTGAVRGWRRTTVGEITTHLTSGSRDWSPYYGRGAATFLMAQNVRPGRLDLSYRQAVDPPIDDASRDRSQVHPGDLLVTIVGANTGDVCRVPHELPEHYVCQSVALMRPSNDVLPQFLDYFLNSPHGQRQYAKFMYGAGRPHLSFEQLRATEVRVPSVEQQRLVVAELEQRLSVLDVVERTLSIQKARAVRLRQSLLRLAFFGHLVPQHARDEPASVLLDRIRRERTEELSPKRRSQSRA